jgi:hypothetical protein
MGMMIDEMVALKKGGKVDMSQKQTVNVKVNVGDVLKKKVSKPRKARKPKPTGDTVLLMKGDVPSRKKPGLHVRFLSPGSVFGGGLPGPLNSASYGSAPPVAQPLGRLDFIGSGEGLHNRGRDRRDDIPINVNPAGIRADITPSMRAVSSSGAVASPDTGLSIARSLQKSYDALSPEFQRIYDKMQFQGELPRLNDPNLQPSSRIAENKPSSGWAEMSRYKPQEYVPPPASLAGASSKSASMASISQPGRERPLITTLSRRPQAERERYDEEALYGPPKQKRQPPVNPQSLRRGGSVF